jgi:cell wall-associated NlpC family hydrolase
LAASKAAFNKQLAPLRALRAKLDPSSLDSGGAASAPVGASTTVRFAYAQLGKPYSFGASGPGSYDCSGLTMMAYRQVGISLPHSAHLQYQQTPKVSRSQIQAGDLVFFYNLGHNGIAISNSKVIHAPTEGENVKITNIDAMDFYGATRPR